MSLPSSAMGADTAIAEQTWIPFVGSAISHGNTLDLQTESGTVLRLRADDVQVKGDRILVRQGAKAISRTELALPASTPAPPPPTAETNASPTAMKGSGKKNGHTPAPSAPSSTAASTTIDLEPKVTACEAHGECACAACIGLVRYCCDDGVLVGACIGFSSCP